MILGFCLKSEFNSNLEFSSGHISEPNWLRLRRKQNYFNKWIHCKYFYFLLRKEYVKYFSIFNDGAKAVRLEAPHSIKI